MDKNALTRRIYITYKARINAAERLKRTEEFIQGLNIYYSLFLTALSIYSVYNCTEKLSLILTISSVILTVSIVFLGAKRYGERAKDLKNNYLLLDELYRNVNSDKEIDVIGEQYSKILNNSENHSTIDYYCAINNISDEKLTRKETFVFYLYKTLNILLKIFLILLPFLLKYIASIIECIIKL